ncbi:MAG: hypothetical protein ACREBR_04975 [bacterium]
MPECQQHFQGTKAFHLEHFILVIGRCRRCDAYLGIKVYHKDDGIKKDQQQPKGTGTGFINGEATSK